MFERVYAIKVAPTSSSSKVNHTKQELLTKNNPIS